MLPWETAHFFRLHRSPLETAPIQSFPSQLGPPTDPGRSKAIVKSIFSSSSAAAVRPNVSILALLSSEQLLMQLQETLDSQQYTLKQASTKAAFMQALGDAQSVDCLLIDESAALPSLFAALQKESILLPIVVLSSGAGHEVYHSAEVNLPKAEIATAGDSINAAIKQFLQLSPKETNFPLSSPPIDNEPASPEALLEQQQRLASKLKERLGYLGVYYKRNSSNFYHNLNENDQQQLIDELTAKYQGILLAYFSDATELNLLIDEFVNLCFFTDISVTQIVEIHMKLIDDYSKQLKLEGRNEAILLNYRLTLLDIISHLCEMYRRSITRES